MKYSFSSNAFRNHSVVEAIDKLSAIGYDGIEIMADRPHAYPPDLSAADIASIVKAAKEHGMEVANINAFTLHAIGDTYSPSWIDSDAALRQQRIDHTIRCIDLAAELGAPCISTEPGGPLRSRNHWQALELFRDGLMQVEERALQRGVKVLIEPEPGLLIESSRQFIEFYGNLPSDIFGLNFDIGHFYCVGEEPATLVRELRHAIHHFHLEDIDTSRRHFHLIPGEGAIHFADVLAAIEEIGYQGFVTVELYTYEDKPEEAAEKALRYLKGYLATAGGETGEYLWNRRHH